VRRRQLRTFLLSLVTPPVVLLAACRPHAPRGETRENSRSASASRRVPIVVLHDTLAVCRLDLRAPLPPWATVHPHEFFSVTRTADELSVIVTQSRPPRDIKCDRNWRLLKVQGPLPLNLIGIIAGLSGTLAAAGVSIFAVSTYDTDYFMVKQVDLGRAVQALQMAGYSVDVSR
jgi:uncharacterized protein